MGLYVERFYIRWESRPADIVIEDKEYPHQPFATFHNGAYFPEAQPAMEKMVEELNKLKMDDTTPAPGSGKQKE